MLVYIEVGRAPVVQYVCDSDREERQVSRWLDECPRLSGAVRELLAMGRDAVDEADHLGEAA